MSTTLAAEVFEDAVVVSLARAMTAANKRARELGIDVLQTLITITQRTLNGSTFWQINYGPKEYIGQRGGDLMIEIDSGDASVQKVLWGQ